MFSETTLGIKKLDKKTSQEPIRADTNKNTGHNMRRRVEKGPIKSADEKQDYRQDNQANGTSSESKAIAPSQKTETNLPPGTTITRRKRPTKQFEVQATAQPNQYSLPTSAEAGEAAENDLNEPERKREKTQLREGSHQSSTSYQSDQEEHPNNGIIRLHICAEEANHGEPQMSTGPHDEPQADDEPQTDGEFQGLIYYYVKEIKEVGLDTETGEFLYRTKWLNWKSHTWEPEESFCTAGSRKLLEEFQQANEDEIIVQSQKAAAHRYLGRKKLNHAFARVDKITDHKLRRKTSFKKHNYIPIFYVHWTNKIEGWATYWELWASQNGLSEYRAYKKKLREEEAARKEASTDRQRKRRGRPPKGDRLSKDTQSTSGAPRKRRIRALKRDKSRREDSWFDPTPVPCYKRTRTDRSQSVAPSSFSPCVGEESTTRSMIDNVRSPSEPRATSASIRNRLTICEQKKRDRGSSKDRQMLVVSAESSSSESPVSRSPSGIQAVLEHVCMTADQLPTTIGKVPTSSDTSRETSASDLPSSSVSTSTESVHQSPQRGRGEDNGKAIRQKREVRAGCHTSHMPTAFVSCAPNLQTPSSSSCSSADTAICTGSDEFHDTCYIHASPSISKASSPASVESNVTEKSRDVTSSTSTSSLGDNELRARSDEFNHAHHMEFSSASVDTNGYNVTENNRAENDNRLFFDAFPETHSGSEELYQKFSERFFDTVARQHHFGHKLMTVEILLHGRHNLENPVFQFDPLDRLMTSFEPVGGNTPLHAAVLAKHNSLVKLLLELGCPMDAYPNHNRKTPLALAYGHRNKEIVTILMGAGASYLQFYDRSSRSHYEATKDSFDDCVIYNHDCLRLNLRKLQPKAFMDERFEEVSTVTGSLNDGLRHRFNFDVPTMKLGFQYIAVVVGFGEKCRTRLAKVLVNGERVKKGTYGFICTKLEENNSLELHFFDEKKRGKTIQLEMNVYEYVTNAVNKVKDEKNPQAVKEVLNLLAMLIRDLETKVKDLGGAVPIAESNGFILYETDNVDVLHTMLPILMRNCTTLQKQLERLRSRAPPREGPSPSVSEDNPGAPGTSRDTAPTRNDLPTTSNNNSDMKDHDAPESTDTEDRQDVALLDLKREAEEDDEIVFLFEKPAPPVVVNQPNNTERAATQMQRPAQVDASTSPIMPRSPEEPNNQGRSQGSGSFTGDDCDGDVKPFAGSRPVEPPKPTMPAEGFVPQDAVPYPPGAVRPVEPSATIMPAEESVRQDVVLQPQETREPIVPAVGVQRVVKPDPDAEQAPMNIQVEKDEVEILYSGSRITELPRRAEDVIGNTAELAPSPPPKAENNCYFKCDKIVERYESPPPPSVVVQCDSQADRYQYWTGGSLAPDSVPAANVQLEIDVPEASNFEYIGESHSSESSIASTGSDQNETHCSSTAISTSTVLQPHGGPNYTPYAETTNTGGVNEEHSSDLGNQNTDSAFTYTNPFEYQALTSFEAIVATPPEPREQQVQPDLTRANERPANHHGTLSAPDRPEVLPKATKQHESPESVLNRPSSNSHAEHRVGTTSEHYIQNGTTTSVQASRSSDSPIVHEYPQLVTDSPRLDFSTQDAPTPDRTMTLPESATQHTPSFTVAATASLALTNSALVPDSTPPGPSTQNIRLPAPVPGDIAFDLKQESPAPVPSRSPSESATLNGHPAPVVARTSVSPAQYRSSASIAHPTPSALSSEDILVRPPVPAVPPEFVAKQEAPASVRSLPPSESVTNSGHPVSMTSASSVQKTTLVSIPDPTPSAPSTQHIGVRPSVPAVPFVAKQEVPASGSLPSSGTVPKNGPPVLVAAKTEVPILTPKGEPEPESEKPVLPLSDKNIALRVKDEIEIKRDPDAHRSQKEPQSPAKATLTPTYDGQGSSKRSATTPHRGGSSPPGASSSSDGSQEIVKRKRKSSTSEPSSSPHTSISGPSKSIIDQSSSKSAATSQPHQETLNHRPTSLTEKAQISSKHSASTPPRTGSSPPVALSSTSGAQKGVKRKPTSSNCESSTSKRPPQTTLSKTTEEPAEQVSLKTVSNVQHSQSTSIHSPTLSTLETPYTSNKSDTASIPRPQSAADHHYNLENSKGHEQKKSSKLPPPPCPPLPPLVTTSPPENSTVDDSSVSKERKATEDFLLQPEPQAGPADSPLDDKTTPSSSVNFRVSVESTFSPPAIFALPTPFRRLAGLELAEPVVSPNRTGETAAPASSDHSVPPTKPATALPQASSIQGRQTSNSRGLTAVYDQTEMLGYKDDDENLYSTNMRVMIAMEQNSPRLNVKKKALLTSPVGNDFARSVRRSHSAPPPRTSRISSASTGRRTPLKSSLKQHRSRSEEKGLAKKPKKQQLRFGINQVKIIAPNPPKSRVHEESADRPEPPPSRARSSNPVPSSSPNGSRFGMKQVRTIASNPSNSRVHEESSDRPEPPPSRATSSTLVPSSPANGSQSLSRTAPTSQAQFQKRDPNAKTFVSYLMEHHPEKSEATPSTTRRARHHNRKNSRPSTGNQPPRGNQSADVEGQRPGSSKDGLVEEVPSRAESTESTENPLFLAVRNDSPSVVHDLIRNRALINYYPKGSNPLKAAFERGNLQILCHLLSAGADYKHLIKNAEAMKSPLYESLIDFHNGSVVPYTEVKDSLCTTLLAPNDLPGRKVKFSLTRKDLRKDLYIEFFTISHGATNGKVEKVVINGKMAQTIPGSTVSFTAEFGVKNEVEIEFDNGGKPFQILGFWIRPRKD